jgi:phosphoadenosine phosphosulfate reductase
MSATSALPWAAAAPSAAKSSAIALYARWSPELDGKIAAAQQRLREAVMQHDVGLLQSSSLGVEDMVVTDLIHRAGLRIDVATLDTGKLHPETLALLPRIRRATAGGAGVPAGRRRGHRVRAA